MGNEAFCRVDVRSGRRRTSGEGKALLETDELIVRGSGGARGDGGDFRLRIALKDVVSAASEGSVLVLETKDGTVARLEVGRVAARWAEKIRSPPSRLDKLGIAADGRVALVGAFDDAFIAEVEARATVTKTSSIVLFAAAAVADLARVATLRKKLPDDGALWIVYPKGRKEIREADVLAAGRAAGLKDVKVARFSDTHTALKFVVPVSARK